MEALKKAVADTECQLPEEASTMFRRHMEYRLNELETHVKLLRLDHGMKRFDTKQ